jgi:hypothetical protein
MTLIAESSQTPYAVNKTKRSFDSGIAIRSVTGVEHVVTADPLETYRGDMIQCSECIETPPRLLTRLNNIFDFVMN